MSRRALVQTVNALAVSTFGGFLALIGLVTTFTQFLYLMFILAAIGIVVLLVHLEISQIDDREKQMELQRQKKLEMQQFEMYQNQLQVQLELLETLREIRTALRLRNTDDEIDEIIKDISPMEEVIRRPVSKDTKS